MILVIEIAFLIAGIYALITAKMPKWLIGKNYKAEGTPVRLLGVLMAATLPLVMCGSIGIGIVGGMTNTDPKYYAMGFEVVFVIVIAIVVTIVLRRIRQPDVASPGNPPPSQLN